MYEATGTGDGSPPRLRPQDEDKGLPSWTRSWGRLSCLYHGCGSGTMGRGCHRGRWSAIYTNLTSLRQELQYVDIFLFHPGTMRSGSEYQPELAMCLAVSPILLPFLFDLCCR